MADQLSWLEKGPKVGDNGAIVSMKKSHMWHRYTSYGL